MQLLFSDGVEYMIEIIIGETVSINRPIKALHPPLGASLDQTKWCVSHMFQSSQPPNLIFSTILLLHTYIPSPNQAISLLKSSSCPSPNSGMAFARTGTDGQSTEEKTAAAPRDTRARRALV